MHNFNRLEPIRTYSYNNICATLLRITFDLFYIDNHIPIVVLLKITFDWLHYGGSYLLCCNK